MVLLTGLLWSMPFGEPVAYGEEVAQVAQVDTTDEDNQSDKSKKAQQKLDDASNFASKTWNRVSDWVMGYVNGFKAKVDNVFGFDKGEASGAFFGTVLYAAVGLVLLFVVMFVYNIISDMLHSSAAKKKYKKRR